jgi:hypothetical protein
MHLTNTILSPRKQEETVVVKLWEIYLLYHPANLYRVLTDFSVDGGPLEDKKLSGRVVFRFSRTIWETEIRDLLYQYRIPVVIQSNRLEAVKIKGRHPVLR